MGKHIANGRLVRRICTCNLCSRRRYGPLVRRASTCWTDRWLKGNTGAVARGHLPLKAGLAAVTWRFWQQVEVLAVTLDEVRASLPSEEVVASRQ